MHLHFLTRAIRLVPLVLIIALATPAVATGVLSAQSTPEVTLGGTPGATPIAGVDTETVIAAADAYVVQNTPDQNYGDRGTLISDEDLMSIAYVQFDVEGVEQVVERATFRVWVTDPAKAAPVLWLTPPVPLDEQSVTWNTRPALDVLVEIKDGQGATQGRWLEYDVSGVVTGDGIYSFALVPASTDGLDFRSREADERQPELVLELGAEQRGAGPAPSAGDAPVLLAAGDIATCNDGAEQTALILDEEFGTIAALGDNAYNEGTAEQFAECYDPTWGRHKDRTKPVPGNHEYYTSGAEPYFEYFGEAAGEPGEGYYSYTLGNWQIIAINTNIQTKEDSDQMEWLRNELESNPAQCTLVYGHHPRFSSGSHGPNAAMDPLFTTLYDYGVEIYLAGHDHNYERFLPQDPGGGRADRHGVRQFVVGTGGIALRPFEHSVENSEVRSADALGVIRFTLYDDSYEWEFLGVEGESFYDSGEDDCHDAPAEPWEQEEGRRMAPYAVIDYHRTQRAQTAVQRTTM